MGKLLQFKKPSQIQQDIDNVRMERIRESLEKINRMMRELKEQQQQLPTENTNIIVDKE